MLEREEDKSETRASKELDESAVLSARSLKSELYFLKFGQMSMATSWKATFFKRNLNFRHFAHGHFSAHATIMDNNRKLIRITLIRFEELKSSSFHFCFRV